MVVKEYNVIVLLGKNGMNITTAKGKRLSPKAVKYKLNGYDYNFDNPGDEYVRWIKGKPTIGMYTNDGGKTFSFWKINIDNENALIEASRPDNSYIVREEIANQKRMLSQKEWWQENMHYILIVIFGFFLLVSSIMIFMGLKKLDLAGIQGALNNLADAVRSKPI